MAAKKIGNRLKDRPQWYWQDITPSAGTATKIAAINTSFNAKDEVGVLIHKVALRTNDPFGQAAIADTEELVWGLTSLWGGGTAPTEVNQNGVQYWRSLARHDWNQVLAAESLGNSLLLPTYIEDSLGDYPLLMHPAALFPFIREPANALSALIGIFFEYVELTTEEYKEFFQALTSNAV